MHGKTGDLLMYCHDRDLDKTLAAKVTREVFVRAMDAPVSHVGFILRVADKLYLTEVRFL